MKYSHAYDFAFEVITDIEDPSQVPAQEILKALLIRGATLPMDEVHEACQCFDSVEVED